MNRLTDYLTFVSEHPAFFENPLGGAEILLNEKAIQIAETQASQQLVSQGLPAEWAQVGIAYQDQYVTLLRDAVRFSDGSTAIFTRQVNPVESAPGVVVLPVYQGQVLLLRHFRHDTRSWHLEIPQGFGMPGLSSEECAQRELEEEISAKVSRLVSLGSMYLDTSTDGSPVELFYAEIENYGDVELAEGITEILLTPVSDVERMIRDHELTNMFLLGTYTRAKFCNLL